MSRKAKSPDGIRGFANACMGRGGNSAGPLGDRPQQQVLVPALELTGGFAGARANNTIQGLAEIGSARGHITRSQFEVKVLAASATIAYIGTRRHRG